MSLCTLLSLCGETHRKRKSNWTPFCKDVHYKINHLLLKDRMGRIELPRSSARKQKHNAIIVAVEAGCHLEGRSVKPNVF